MATQLALSTLPWRHRISFPVYTACVQRILPFERMVEQMIDFVPPRVGAPGQLVKGEATQIVRYRKGEGYAKHFDIKVGSCRPDFTPVPVCCQPSLAAAHPPEPSVRIVELKGLLCCRTGMRPKGQQQLSAISTTWQEVAQPGLSAAPAVPSWPSRTWTSLNACGRHAATTQAVPASVRNTTQLQGMQLVC